MAFFSATWRIENFSMSPHKNGERFFSPKFKLPELANIEWTFSLYPSGRNSIPEGNYVSFYIRRNDSALCSEFTWFNVILTVVNLNNSRNIIYNDNLKITHNGSKGYPKFISHEDLHDYEFLSNDTLTIHVCICPVLDEKTKLTAPDTKNIFPSNPKKSNYTVEKCFSKDSETDDMPLYHCAFLTRIPIERKRLNWTIKELSAKRTKEKVSVTLESEFEEGVMLLVACLFEGSKEDDERLKIDISRKGINFRRTMVKCDVSILDSSDVVLNVKKSEHVFDETYHRWCFPLIDKLSSSQNLINDDTLKLICDFTISYDPQNVDYLTRSESSHLNNLPAEIQKMLEYEETSDVSFECKNEEKFMTHKFLICTKSPVFRAMFSSDTLESQTGMIKMNDTDTDTVRHLRDFMYLKSFPNLGTEDAIKLYTVAEKYQITKLKDKCSGVLKNNMTVENVCEILTFADLHQDSGLRDFIYDFLIAEMNFDSDLWKTLMVENLSLAAETLRKCVIKGQNDSKN